MSLQDLEIAFELIEDNSGDFNGEKDNYFIAKAEKSLVLALHHIIKSF